VAVGAKQICRKPGCTALIDAPGYCQQHKTSSGAWSHDGKTAAQRGYGYAWSKLRRQVMMRDQGLCQPCLALGRVTLATECDHVIGKAQGGSDSLDNAQAICSQCHKDKTAIENGRKVRREIGLDGWPKS